LPPDFRTRTPLLTFKSNGGKQGIKIWAEPGLPAEIDALRGPGVIDDHDGKNADRKERMNKPAQQGSQDVKDNAGCRFHGTAKRRSFPDEVSERRRARKLNFLIQLSNRPQACGRSLAADGARVVLWHAALGMKRAQGRPGADLAHGPPAEKKQAAVTTGSAETSRPSLRDGCPAYT
jgi:hypothetical protein